MAITGGDRLVWRRLREQDAIPLRPCVLEIGRANWYGDVTAEQFWEDHGEFGSAFGPPDSMDPWSVADFYYDFMLHNPVRTPIDLGRDAAAIRHDLNLPLPDALRGPYDLVINTGTAEHVFDLRQLWQTIHEACKPGGLMVHALPLWGWFDHGFVNYQPTFVADLAVENGYEVVCWFLHEIDTGWGIDVTSPTDVAKYQPRARYHSAMMHVVLRKTQDAAFRVPMQGVYSERNTEALEAVWLANR